MSVAAQWIRDVVASPEFFTQLGLSALLFLSVKRLA